MHEAKRSVQPMRSASPARLLEDPQLECAAERTADSMAGSTARVSSLSDSASGVASPASSIDGLGAGQPIPGRERDFFEPRFGWDFRHVRVHADAESARRAASLGARAYTIGSNVIFGAGQFALGSASSRHLLAHELAHVVQQRGSPEAPVMQRKESTAAPIRPVAAIAHHGDADVVTINGHEFAVIRSKTGKLKPKGAMKGQYGELSKPFESSSHASVSLSYAVTLQYENAQDDLTITPGAEQQVVEQKVFPSFDIQVLPFGEASEPAPKPNPNPAPVPKPQPAPQPEPSSPAQDPSNPDEATRNAICQRDGISYYEAAMKYQWPMTAPTDESQHHDASYGTGTTASPPRVAPIFGGFDSYDLAMEENRLPPMSHSNSDFDLQNDAYRLHAIMSQSDPTKIAYWVATDRKTGRAYFIVGGGNVKAFLDNPKGAAEVAARIDMVHAMYPPDWPANPPPGVIRAQLHIAMGDISGGIDAMVTDPATVIGLGLSFVGFGPEEGAAEKVLATDTKLAVTELATEVKAVDAAAKAAPRQAVPPVPRRPPLSEDVPHGRPSPRPGETGDVLDEPTSRRSPTDKGWGNRPYYSRPSDRVPRRAPSEEPGTPMAPEKQVPVKPEAAAPEVQAAPGPLTNDPPAPTFSSQQQKAQELAAAATAKGDPVVVNIGGAGASHEPQGAINVNNQAVSRKNIPNLVQADGSRVGELFEAGTVARVEGHNMAPGVIDWNQAAPGLYRVLKPGGTIRYSYRGSNADAAVAEAALRQAGFQDIKNIADVLLTATRP
nr:MULTISPECIES: DUF4157 domain-containing protein [unclassified Mycolicibacterium]